MSKPIALFVCGPTAVGKTAVAIELAQHFGTEIISFDSRQFYKELQIGAAPPNAQELKKVPHHFIGNLSIRDGNDAWSAGRFAKEALAKLEVLFQKHSLVILVGGSGLYMRALTDGFDNLPSVSPNTRDQLNAELKQLGLEKLTSELKEKDPAYANEVDLQNPQRVIRALEIIRETNKPYSEWRKGEKANRPFRSIKIGLELPRTVLYERINKRVNLMVEAGLEAEAKSLETFKDENALQTVGYREWWPYFAGECPLDYTIEEIKKNSRRYAKRQMTWFKRETDMQWFAPSDLSQILEYVEGKI